MQNQNISNYRIILEQQAQTTTKILYPMLGVFTSDISWVGADFAPFFFKRALKPNFFVHQ